MDRRGSGQVPSPFSPQWEDAYFFVNVEGRAQCLICQKCVSIKSSTVRRHYERKHASTHDSLVGNERTEEVEKLKLELRGSDEIYEPNSSENTVRASYLVALKIAKTSRPFTDGKFVKECLVECSEVLCPSVVSQFEAISLSEQTISRRVQDIGRNLKEQLREKCRVFAEYSLALDESTDNTDTAQLAIFVRGVESNFTVTEELLDLVPLKDTTTGADIYEAVDDTLNEMNLSINHLWSVATDGAPAMMSEGQGFVGRIKKKVREAGLPPIVSLHCIIHQEQLSSKIFEKFKSVTDIVTKCVNYCRKQGLNHRQFKELLKDLEAEYLDIPFYCKVRWLSLAKVLSIFFAIREEIHLFMEMKGNAQPLLKDEQWVADLAFLVDITGYLNDLNISLQGRQKLICTLFDRIKAFKLQIVLFKTQLAERNFENFPSLKSLNLLELEFENLEEYQAALEKLHAEFNARFKEMNDLAPKLQVFATPFSVSPENAPSYLQVELIKLQCDSILKDRYYHFQGQGDLISFYTGLNQADFPKLHALALKFVCMFGTTYLCEMMFSVMNLNKNQYRSCLSDVTLESILRISTAQSLVPNITKLVTDKRCQKSA